MIGKASSYLSVLLLTGFMSTSSHALFDFGYGNKQALHLVVNGAQVEFGSSRQDIEKIFGKPSNTEEKLVIWRFKNGLSFSAGFDKLGLNDASISSSQNLMDSYAVIYDRKIYLNNSTIGELETTYQNQNYCLSYYEANKMPTLEKSAHIEKPFIPVDKKGNVIGTAKPFIPADQQEILNELDSIDDTKSVAMDIATELEELTTKVDTFSESKLSENNQEATSNDIASDLNSDTSSNGVSVNVADFSSEIDKQNLGWLDLQLADSQDSEAFSIFSAISYSKDSLSSSKGQQEGKNLVVDNITITKNLQTFNKNIYCSP